MDDAADEQPEVRRRRHHHTNSHRHPRNTSTLLRLLQWKTLLPLLPNGISLRSYGGVTAWFGSNIEVFLLNKYLLFYYGFCYPIFLTMTHTLSCAAYSSAVINITGIVPVSTSSPAVSF
ncbi:hypothetical protein HID58_019757 [Brassica napus]|uniref:Uncharacterized protein n=1 Tax=Brassica napus TaxID=3708 RepID=A0ABQ8DGB7_BRANA|nr:hypothetical protein HID58_019757 [Brassica napus]